MTYTLHAWVTRDIRTKDGSWSVERVRLPVNVEVDIEAITEWIARRAAHNTTQRASLLSGWITAKVNK